MTVVGRSETVALGDVAAEAETILYSPSLAYLGGDATLVGALVSPDTSYVTDDSRMRGYVYAGSSASVTGAVEWTLDDGTLGGGQVLCRRIAQLGRAHVRYEEKPIQRQVPGLNL